MRAGQDACATNHLRARGEWTGAEALGGWTGSKAEEKQLASMRHDENLKDGGRALTIAIRGIERSAFSASRSTTCRSFPMNRHDLTPRFPLHTLGATALAP